MNRDHYLSKRQQPPLQKPADRQIVPDDNADGSVEPVPPVEPGQTTNAEDAAKQETRSGR